LGESIMRGLSSAFVRLFFAISVCALAYQAPPAHAQSSADQVGFWVGLVDPDRPAPQFQAPARDYAAYYAPYAMQAALAYLPYKSAALYSLGGSTRDEYSFALNVDATTQKLFRTWNLETDSEKLLAESIANQALRDQKKGYLGCLDDTDECRQAQALHNCKYCYQATGLAFQIWARYHSNRASGACSEVSIAFRGSRLAFSSWFSNLRWLDGGLGDDEYDQLGRNIDAVLHRIKKLDCFKDKTQIVTVGHSLGGGLAQYAALVHSPSAGRISKVFAFDSSPVTGGSSVNAQTLIDNGKKLTIDRVYQEGEILTTYVSPAIDRVLGSDTSASACNPLVRSVKFNVVQGVWYLPRFISGHSMQGLAGGLVALSEPPPQKYKALPIKASSRACETDYEMLQPEQEETPVASVGMGRNLYNYANPNQASVGGRGPPSALPADAGYSGQGYRADGSYGPIVALYSDQTGARADLRGMRSRTAHVHSHRVAALPGHRAKKVRTARS
jgi:pimeloyl-ACP methyl ester carboxylesterase